MTKSVCIVDDDAAVRDAMAALVRSLGMEAESFALGRDLLARTSRDVPACIVLDMALPDLTGLELQEQLKRIGVEAPVVFVTGRATIAMSVRALKAGAVEFLTKPVSPDAFVGAIRQATSSSPSPRQEAREYADHFPAIVGRSGALRNLFEHLESVAATESTVLICGETGTGKELVARAIHERSGKVGRFVKINCAAIPSGLLESELLGHERGAFTGAINQRLGRFELAQDGTLFLDEVAEMPLELQPKLLRVLQEREFERVGGSKTLRSNARVLAATNCDLQTMVEQRTFRDDLFYRLNVFPLQVPPLRARREDIPDLARHFMREIARAMGKKVPHVSPTALAALMQHDWPGNIRELQNILERAVILSSDVELELPPFSCLPRAASTSRIEGTDDMAAVSKAHIRSVLQATNWVVAGPYGAAARLGMKRSTLIFRMKKLGIDREAAAPSYR
jgi:DNA-binding NtrC family response regulator